MEFWGVEVKSGETLKVVPGEDMVLHLSQACLGELKKDKGNESVCLFVNVNGKRLVLGTLFSEKLPQQQFDLVFDREFDLSHNWKNGTVYFYGYRANNPFEEYPLNFELYFILLSHEMSGGSESESEEDIPLVAANNGKPEAKAKAEKPAEVGKAIAVKGKESAGKQKVEPSKKRASESATKTPVQDKKAKVTPQKTDGKKVSGHVATPHPAKQAGKTPANKPNQQTPQSGSSHLCKSCSRTFNSDKALESHTKAKHTASKK
ncbi:hypothetical protein C2S52_019676 [Perilla frutescens var. hirtella]|nr:hypothetical protein C2S52_019676 [Perilla frutescens var. hirtella]KAH6806079.1 hypothetical protein C2S51_030910 [Perilla frutescens var. frutescens]